MSLQALFPYPHVFPSLVTHYILQVSKDLEAMPADYLDILFGGAIEMLNSL
jgi:hypothetical protein